MLELARGNIKPLVYKADTYRGQESPRSPTARVHVAAGGNIIRKSFLLMAKCRGDGKEPPQRMQRCRRGSVVLSPQRVPKHRPQQHQEPYCLSLRLLLYHLGRPIKGNWNTKTTRYTTTWLIARPETGLIISQST